MNNFIKKRFALSELGAKNFCKGMYWTVALDIVLMLPAVFVFATGGRGNCRRHNLRNGAFRIDRACGEKSKFSDTRKTRKKTLQKRR